MRKKIRRSRLNSRWVATTVAAIILIGLYSFVLYHNETTDNRSLIQNVPEDSSITIKILSHEWRTVYVIFSIDLAPPIQIGPGLNYDLIARLEIKNNSDQEILLHDCKAVDAYGRGTDADLIDTEDDYLSLTTKLSPGETVVGVQEFDDIDKTALPIFVICHEVRSINAVNTP